MSFCALAFTLHGRFFFVFVLGKKEVSYYGSESLTQKDFCLCDTYLDCLSLSSMASTSPSGSASSSVNPSPRTSFSSPSLLPRNEATGGAVHVSQKGSKDDDIPEEIEDEHRIHTQYQASEVEEEAPVIEEEPADVVDEEAPFEVQEEDEDE